MLYIYKVEKKLKKRSSTMPTTRKGGRRGDILKEVKINKLGWELRGKPIKIIPVLQRVGLSNEVNHVAIVIRE